MLNKFSLQWLSLQIWRLEEVHMRADIALCQCLGISRSQLKNRLQQLQCNGREIRSSHQLKPGDQIKMLLREEASPTLEAEKIALDIIYQDKDLFVLNKAQGMVVHPGDGNQNGTVVQGILYYDQQFQQLDANPLRLGLVHRLDKDTSGLLLVARNSSSLSYLSEQFAQRQVEKHYLALVRGHIANRGTVDAMLRRDPRQRKRFTVSLTSRGKDAQTDYRVLARSANYSLVKLSPRTGRTHQLRCHLQYLKAPIVGDPIYSRKDPQLPEASLMLHAFALRVRMPTSGESRLFYAPLPKHFRSTIKQLQIKQ